MGICSECRKPKIPAALALKLILSDVLLLESKTNIFPFLKGIKYFPISNKILVCINAFSLSKNILDFFEDVVPLLVIIFLIFVFFVLINS